LSRKFNFVFKSDKNRPILQEFILDQKVLPTKFVLKIKTHISHSATTLSIPAGRIFMKFGI